MTETGQTGRAGGAGCGYEELHGAIKDALHMGASYGFWVRM